MENLELYNKCKAVPDIAKRPIKGGRMSGKTDINPVWRIKTLTEQFGPCGIGWYYKPLRKWMETYNEETAAFVDIELFIKVDNEWSMPISGTGGSMFVAKEKSGSYVSDECYKMATTDAISVACKQLGIGADVYYAQDSSTYDEPENEKPKKPKESEKPYTLDENLLRSIYDLTEEYAQMLDGITQAQIFNMLQSKYRYKDINILSVENAATLINQLEKWICKQREKNESD